MPACRNLGCVLFYAERPKLDLNLKTSGFIGTKPVSLRYKAAQGLKSFPEYKISLNSHEKTDDNNQMA